MAMLGCQVMEADVLLGGYVRWRFMESYGICFMLTE